MPLFKRIGLGSVLGYLVAGCLIGPSVFGVVKDAESILHMAELGVVMFLFIIGLEMHPERLWAMRKAIFGRGFLQVGLCGALLTFAGIYILNLPKESHSLRVWALPFFHRDCDAGIRRTRDYEYTKRPTRYFYLNFLKIYPLYHYWLLLPFNT